MREARRVRMVRRLWVQWVPITLMSLIWTWPVGADRHPEVTMSWYRQDVQGEIERIAAAATPAQLSTGMLHTTARSLVNLTAYNGSETAAPLSFQTWRQIYFEMLRSVHPVLLMPSLQDLELRARRAARSSRILLAVLDVRYNLLQLMELSVRAQPLQLGGEVEPVFPEAGVFAVSALRDEVRQGERLTFELDPAFYVSNTTALKQMTIDFDDGLGPRELGLGASVNVRYLDTGTKQIQVIAHDVQGHIRHSAFPLQVRPGRQGTPLVPHIIWADRTADIPYLEDVAGYDAYVFLGSGNARLTRPMLIVEGFDVDDRRGWEDTIDRLQEVSLAERLLLRGFDLIIIDFADATDYIQRNSFALVQLIETVIAERSGNQALSVVGVSQGGVIARYALSWMEAHDRAHQTRLFASIDSPHQGANIPLGLQFWIAFFAKYSADADALLDVLNSPAAQQLLVYHHRSMPQLDTNPLRAILISDLTRLGNYPRRSRNIAVANGSGTGIAAPQVGDKQVPMAPGERLLDWEVDTFALEIKGRVRAAPDQEPETQIFEGKFDLLFFDSDRLNVYIRGTKPYDNAPGGWRDSLGQLAASEPLLGDITTDFPQHAFVTTISALDLRNDLGEPLPLFHNLNRDPDLLSKTPFDALVYAPDLENQQHVELTLENVTFLLDELSVE